MLLADLYYARIDVQRHLPQPGPDCRDCDAASCRSFAARLADGRLAEEARRGPLPPEDCPLLTADRLDAFRVALAPETLLPTVELSQLPQPVEPGLTTLGEPQPTTPIVVSANHEGTATFLTALLARAAAPLHYLAVDTRGDSVDMAMILGSLTAERLLGALETADLRPSAGRRLLLPGFAASVAIDVAAASAWETAIGPACGAELPLWLGRGWKAAG